MKVFLHYIKDFGQTGWGLVLGILSYPFSKVLKCINFMWNSARMNVFAPLNCPIMVCDLKQTLHSCTFPHFKLPSYCSLLTRLKITICSVIIILHSNAYISAKGNLKIFIHWVGSGVFVLLLMIQVADEDRNIQLVMPNCLGWQAEFLLGACKWFLMHKKRRDSDLGSFSGPSQPPSVPKTASRGLEDAPG